MKIQYTEYDKFIIVHYAIDSLSKKKLKEQKIIKSKNFQISVSKLTKKIQKLSEESFIYMSGNDMYNMTKQYYKSEKYRKLLAQEVWKKFS